MTGFVDNGDMSFAAMSAGPQCWQAQPEIKEYARACALVALPGGGGYFVDRFDVQGGKQHDYSFHGQVTEKGEGFTIEGATPKPVENAWTLAGLSGHADATYDAPGRSWGERVLPGNAIRKLGIPGEKVGHFGWFPPPGNGYGYIYDVKSGPAGRKVTADWTTQKEMDIHLRLTLFPGDGSTIITGKGPDLLGKQIIPFFIARRKGEGMASSFLGVMEGYKKKPRIVSVEEGQAADGMRSVVVKAGDVVDHVSLSTNGRSSLARSVSGKVAELAVYQASKVEQAGVGLTLTVPALQGRVTSLDYPNHILATDIKVPNPSALIGRTLFVSSPDYNHNTAYRIESCDEKGRFGFGLVGFDLATLDYKSKDKKGVITTSTPMPLAWTSGKPRASGLLDGKLCLTPDGARRGCIKAFVRPNRFEFKPDATIAQGDRFAIYDVKEGDTVTVPMAASMQQAEDGTWALRTTCDVIIRLETEKVFYRGPAGKWIAASKQDNGFRVPASGCARGMAVLRME
ncbi:MAG: hypothetical protein GXP25_03695 [Planctomycetes bacterium]|nr:hypothetical protein [Planctomycetota bacterium]